MENEKKHIEISGRKIGEGFPVFIIAEVAQAHDGSLGMAHAYIDAAAKAGVDAVKFQTHIAEAESTREESFRVKVFPQDKSRYEYWKRMEFSEDQWRELSEHAHDSGLLFLSTPFSVDAVNLLEKLSVPAWKIGSGEINNPQLLSEIVKTNKPILLSTGMSHWSEITEAVERITASGTEFALMQCTSKYPTHLKDVGLNVLQELRERYDVVVGLSDHSGTIFPALAAMATTASIIEVHVVFSKEMFGPDVSSSVNMEELSLISEARDAFFEMKMNPVDKDVLGRELNPMREMFNKSVSARFDIPKGAVLTRDMLTVKKPGIGIPAGKLDECIGRRTTRYVSSDRVMVWDDIEESNE